MNNRRYRAGGFTLIELLAVVVILGILLTLGIAAYVSSMKTSRGSTANANAKAIATAVQSAFVAAGGNSYNASPMTDLTGMVTTDLGGTIPTNPCTGTNSVGASPNAWTVTILGGGTGWTITPNDPNGACGGLKVVQLGS